MLSACFYRVIKAQGAGRNGSAHCPSFPPPLRSGLCEHGLDSLARQVEKSFRVTYCLICSTEGKRPAPGQGQGGSQGQGRVFEQCPELLQARL